MFPSRRIATMGGDKFRDEYSLAFDGTNDYIDCGDVSDWNFDNGSASIFSVSVWFKSADGTPASNDTLVAKYDTSDNKREWRLSVDASARIKVFTSSNGTSTASSYISYVVADTNWHHVVFTYDGSEGSANDRPTIYVDGVEYGQTIGGTHPAQLNESDRPLVIGCFTSAGSNASEWYGNISEVAIYNSALTASQVKTLYNGREPYNHKEGIATGNLKAWWRMGDGTFDQKSTDDAEGGIVTDMATPTLGADVLGGKGDFSDPSYWDITTDESIVEDGVGKWLGAGGYGHIRKLGILTVGQLYRVDLDVNAHDGTLGSTHCITLNEGSNSIYIRIHIAGTTGHFTTYYKPTLVDFVMYQASDRDVVAEIDNVVIRPVNGNAGAMQNFGGTIIGFTGDTP